jgi:hypothetical protein
LLGKALIWTPEYERLGQQVARWICMEVPGAFVFGVQRSGKSCSARMLASTIEEFTGSRMYASFVSVSPEMPEKGPALIAEWLNREKVLFTGTNAAVLQRKLTEHFAAQAADRETDEICLIVDEAQNLSRSHLFKLLHLGNILTDANFRVFTLLCGQPELASRVESFAAMSEVHLLGRFFERKHEYVAVAPASIETIIKAHEANVSNADGTESPPAVALVFPEAWEAGWRPSQWTQAIKDGIALVAMKNNLSRDQRVPLQHLRACIIWQIMHQKAAGDPWIKVTPQMVVLALEESGLAGSWTRYAAAKRAMGS